MEFVTLLLGISAVSGLVAVLSYRYGFTHSIVLLALLVVGLALLGVHLSRAQGVGASVLYLVFTTRLEAFSRAVFVLDWLLLVVLLGGSRVGFRLLGERLRPRSVGLRRALIYGAGDGGALTLRELRNNAALRREVVGFLDDDQGKRGTRIHGLPVLGGLEMAEEVLAAQAVGEVIVASEKIPPERVRRLEAMCTARGIAVTRATLRIE
jgi:FlaA1/EpsC-like NDP-sugar epimerase